MNTADWKTFFARRRTGLVCLALAAATLAVFWPATRCEFINYDDPVYVTENPHVQRGLTWEGLGWAFGRIHGEGTYWHPLTWVSHMVDCQLYGLRPQGHHATSVLIHALNAALVFLVFRRMTGAFWRCVVLAGLFALHPLQVDSVAWVTERKNLLSAFFWLLTVWAYSRYAEGQRQPRMEHGWNTDGGRQTAETGRTTKAGRRETELTTDELRWTRMGEGRRRNVESTFQLPSSIFYLLALLFFALGLMSKPVLVTLPFVLLLLDYWPLGRLELNTQHSTLNTQHPTSNIQHPTSNIQHPTPNIQHSTFNTQHPTLKTVLPLLVEKLPFFALAMASSAITMMAHYGLGTLGAAAGPPGSMRLENALLSYVRYLGKAVWPSRLAVFYPYPASWPMGEVVACGLVLLVICGLVLATARRRPWLLVGWFWFLGVLVPVIGLVQAGEQAMADRFMYIPLLGLAVAIVWGLHGLPGGGRAGQVWLAVAGSAAIALCIVLTRQQLGHWQNSETLFRHALAVTADNYLGHKAIGDALIARGRVDEAIREYQEALRLKPNRADAYNNLGLALHRKGRTDEAIRQFQEALRLRPEDAKTRNNLAIVLAGKGQIEEAINQFREALRLKPNSAEAHNNLGLGLYRIGRNDEAIREYQQALRLKPDYANAHNNLGSALLKQGQTGEAIAHFQEALRLKPDYANARNNLARALGMKSAAAGTTEGHR